MSWGIMQQRCCGIDIERGTYHDKDIGLTSDFAGQREIRYIFAKENDIWAEE